MFCHNCGTEIPENARFCVKCGTPLGKDIPSKPGAVGYCRRKIVRYIACGAGVILLGGLTSYLLFYNGKAIGEKMDIETIVAGKIFSDKPDKKKEALSTDISMGNELAMAMQTALAVERAYDVAPNVDYARFPNSLKETPDDEKVFWEEVVSIVGELEEINVKAGETLDGTPIDPVFYYTLSPEDNTIEIYIDKYMVYPTVDKELDEKCFWDKVADIISRN